MVLLLLPALQILFLLGLFARLSAQRLTPLRAAGPLVLLAAAELAAAALGIPAAAVELPLFYGINRLFFHSRPALSAAASLLAFDVSLLSFGICDSVVSLLLPLVPEAARRPLLFVSTAAALALCAACCRLLPRLLPRETTPALWMLLLPCLFLSAVELPILRQVYGVARLPAPAEPARHLTLLLLQLLGLGALLCALYIYRRSCLGLQTQAALDALTQAAHAQAVYVEEARSREAAARSFRHDLRQHLTVLAGLLESGRPEEARSYLKQLEISAAPLFPVRPTGHPAVDVLLREKLALAAARGISTEVSITLPPACGIDELDLCVIFANALDNALRACAAVQEAPYLRIRGERQGDFCLLCFENSCLPGPPPQAGVGLGNLRSAAEKYGGAVTAETRGGGFSLHVLLNISERQNGS